MIEALTVAEVLSAIIAGLVLAALEWARRRERRRYQDSMRPPPDSVPTRPTGPNPRWLRRRRER